MPGAKAEQAQAATTEASTATEKMFTQADLDAAVTDAKAGMISEADAKQLATKAATSERTRIMAIHASCQGSNAGKMFVNLVNDGCTEQQANARIQDALAMASDALDIQSHHGGDGGAPKAKIDTAEIYSRVK